MSSSVLLGRSRRLTVLLLPRCVSLWRGGCMLYSRSAPRSMSETVLQALTRLSLVLQERLPDADGQIVAAATAAYSLSGAVPPPELVKILPPKARDGRHVVLMVALLSGCQVDSSCLAMINQVKYKTLIRYSLVLATELVLICLKGLKAEINPRFGPRFSEVPI